MKSLLAATLTLAAAPTIAAAQCPYVELTPSGHGPGLRFGSTLAVDGDTAIVASLTDLHAFERTPQGWMETQVFPLWPGLTYVTSLALDGDWLLVGHGNSGPSFQGRAAVFQRVGGVWQPHQQLAPSQDQAYANFGADLELEGDLAAIGAQGWRPQGQGHCFGAVYLFTRTPNGWQEIQHVTPSDAQDYRFFGASLALDGELLAIGAPGDDQFRGATYLFERGPGGWSEADKIQIDGAQQWDQFGSAVDLFAGTLLTGAPQEGALSSGAAYLHVRTPAGWSQVQRIVPDNPWWELDFGRTVQIEGDRLFIGNYPEMAAGAHVGIDSYRRTGQGWVRSGRFVHPLSVLSWPTFWAWTYTDGALWVGDLGDSPAGTNAGSVVVFETCDYWTSCESRPSSTGESARLDVWSGTPSVAAGDLVLFASPVPNEPGTLLLSREGSGVRFAGGVLCVGAPFERYPATQGGGGALVQAIDVTALPGGAGAVLPGDTWHFQFWFRDSTGGPAGSNLSDALGVVFRP